MALEEEQEPTLNLGEDCYPRYWTIKDVVMIEQLQTALEKCMTGGNHIASNLLSAELDPIIYENYEDAMEGIRSQYTDQQWLSIYDQWCCWKQIMEARKIARIALKNYNGDIKGCFKD